MSTATSDGMPVLKPGVYRLSRDVETPDGDARCVRNYWRRPRWLKGHRFLVETVDLHPDRFQIVSLAPRGSSCALLMVPANRRLIDSLTPFLEEEPESLQTIMDTRHVSGEWIVRTLLEQGRVTLEDVKKALGSMPF